MLTVTQVYGVDPAGTRYGYEDEIRSVFFPGHLKKDVAFLHVESKTLIEADLLFNLPMTESVRSLSPTRCCDRLSRTVRDVERERRTAAFARQCTEARRMDSPADRQYFHCRQGCHEAELGRRTRAGLREDHSVPRRAHTSPLPR